MVPPICFLPTGHSFEIACAGVQFVDLEWSYLDSVVRVAGASLSASLRSGFETGWRPILVSPPTQGPR